MKTKLFFAHYQYQSDRLQHLFPEAMHLSFNGSFMQPPKDQLGLNMETLTPDLQWVGDNALDQSRLLETIIVQVDEAVIIGDDLAAIHYMASFISTHFMHEALTVSVWHTYRWDHDYLVQAVADRQPINPTCRTQYVAEAAAQRLVNYPLSATLTKLIEQPVQLTYPVGVALQLLSEAQPPAQPVLSVTHQDQRVTIPLDLQGNIPEHVSVARIRYDRQPLPPPPPFTFSELVAEAYQRWQLLPRMTYAILEDLYGTGFISYPFSESTFVPTATQTAVRTFLKKTYTQAYLPDQAIPSRIDQPSGSTAMVPTQYDLEASDLPSHMQDLYGLIRDRFFASQLAPATLCQQTINWLNPIDDSIISTTHQTIHWGGWLDIYRPHDWSCSAHLQIEKGDTVPITLTPSASPPPLTLIDVLKMLCADGTPALQTIQTIQLLVNQHLVAVTDQDGCELTPLGTQCAKLLHLAYPDLWTREHFQGFNRDMYRYAWHDFPYTDILQDLWYDINQLIHGLSGLFTTRKNHPRCPQCDCLLVINHDHWMCLNDLTCGYSRSLKRQPVVLKPIKVGDA